MFNKSIQDNRNHFYYRKKVKFDIAVYYIAVEGVHNRNMECAPHKQIPRQLMVGLMVGLYVRTDMVKYRNNINQNR